MKTTLESRIDNLLKVIDTQGGDKAKLDVFLRKELLRLKTEITGLRMPQEVIDFIAEKIDSNVKDLEEFSTDLIAHAVTRRKPLDLNLARSFFAKRRRKKSNL